MESYICRKRYEGLNEIMDWVPLEAGGTAYAKVLWQMRACSFQELKGQSDWTTEKEAREFRVFYAALTMMQYVCENIW